jgi:hypothetical protein
MAPKEAIDILRGRAECASICLSHLGGFHTRMDRYEQRSEEALATLTHHLTTRTEPPTHEDVGTQEECLVYWLSPRGWSVSSGHTTRAYWRDGMMWLPIPKVGV